MTLGPGLTRLVEQFGWARVLVLGDVILDEWLLGSCTNVAREAPVPTVSVRYRDGVPGGAGNTAANVAALGGRVRLLAAVGDDPLARQLSGAVRRRGVEDSFVTCRDRRTMAKRRVVVGHQVLARFDEGDTGHLPDDLDAEVAERLEVLLPEADAVVLADYGLGTCTGPAVRDAVARVSRRVPLLVDAHDVRSWRHCAPTVVTPNWAETRQVLGIGPEIAGPARIAHLDAGRDRLLAATGSEHVVATLDGDGAVVLDSAGSRHVPTRRVAEPHSAGAGDTLSATLALGLAVGGDVTEALQVAVAAATVVVQRPGTATCSSDDLITGPEGALLTAERLIDLCREHRAAGRRIAFSNGCFDVLHAGHVACLQAAADHADVVVLAINNDAGVRAIKGPGRPVNRVADRAAVLAALDTVDHVVAFDGAAPLGLIEAIRPDVYVKGADHDVSALREARAVRRLGGRVHTVPLLPDRSTSGVIAACAAAQTAPA